MVPSILRRAGPMRPPSLMGSPGWGGEKATGDRPRWERAEPGPFPVSGCGMLAIGLWPAGRGCGGGEFSPPSTGWSYATRQLAVVAGLEGLRSPPIAAAPGISPAWGSRLGPARPGGRSGPRNPEPGLGQHQRVHEHDSRPAPQAWRKPWPLWAMPPVAYALASDNAHQRRPGGQRSPTTRT